MEDQALLEAINQMMDAKLTQQKDEIKVELEAINQTMDAKLAQQKNEIKVELEAMESRIMKGAAALMDAEFEKHFHLLSERQEAALAHAATDDDLDIMDGRIETLEKVVRKHTRELSQLKRAN